jgi:hypothetical protein
MNRPSSRGIPRLLAAVALALAAAVVPIAALAGDGGLEVDASSRDVSKDAGDVETSSAAPEVARFATTARQVTELVDGTLGPLVDASSLFDIAIEDEALIDLEAARLALLATDAGGGSGAALVGGRARRDGGATDAAPILRVPALAARLELDRARLAFYRLPTARRHEILAAHAARGAEAGTVSNVDRRARETEEQREAALQNARESRSEGQRLVSTEYARLLDVEGDQARFTESLAADRRAITARRESTLVWQRRAREARSDGATADQTYDELRSALRAARDAFASSLDELTAQSSHAPVVGPDALADVSVDVDTSAARAQRQRVEVEHARLTADERAVREDSTAQLLDEIDTLNRERLALLDALSPARREAITGFTAAGLDQATSELRQLTLILRYHWHIVTTWIASLRHPDRALGRIVAGGVLGVVEWILAIGAFLWWRRRADGFLEALRERARAESKHARRTTASLAERALTFALEVHRPAEWLLLLVVLTWLLPDAVQAILEVRVASTVATWIFGAGLVIDALNAFAASDGGLHPISSDDTSALRLQSLRLVGRTVVVFGLILVISSMVVGHGTIYQWVFSTCWLASLPIVLVLVRRWREVVFLRTERARRKTPFQQWVLANRHGWTSFVAATAGAAHLFVTGGIRAGRAWVGRFDVTRRFLAYLFRRELSKLGSERALIVAGDIPPGAFTALGPETESATWVPTSVDETLARVAARLRERRGGIVALVGERGMGKTSALRRIRGGAADCLFLDTPVRGGVAGLCPSLARALGCAELTLDEAARTLDASTVHHGILLDDIHHFVHPIVGGLADFDALLAVASHHSKRTTWVFTLDDVIWQFLERSRGARPLFDEVVRLVPWREEEIVGLLRSRTAEAGLAPTFVHLLERQAAGADEIDVQEALARREADYYRLLWDYAFGNPSVALHMWRRSLGVDNQGAAAVRLFAGMDTSDFERLPDKAVFVLRAVLQLAPARPEDIARATMLRPVDVSDALRYAAARGYLEEVDGRYRVTWTWFRAITVFLQRRHLMVQR